MVGVIVEQVDTSSFEVRRAARMDVLFANCHVGAEHLKAERTRRERERKERKC